MLKEFNIVVIDDEEICLTSIELMLLDTPHSLKKFTLGEEGLKYIIDNHQDVDIVLLDIMLPDISGLEILSKLKEFDNIRVILQTGAKQSNIPDTAEILFKPFTREQLVNIL